MARFPFLQGKFYPLRVLLEDHFRHGTNMINNLWGIHLQLEAADFKPNRLDQELHAPLVLVACQLTSDTVWNRVGDSAANFWNRIYYEYSTWCLKNLFSTSLAIVCELDFVIGWMKLLCFGDFEFFTSTL